MTPSGKPVTKGEKMNSQKIIAMHNQYVMPTYTPELALVRGEGVRVWDAEGRKYLDFLAGIAVTVAGHCHPRLVEAIRQQAGRLMHVSNLYYNEVQPQLAQALSERSLDGKCFFCNSGAEANEALIKLARRWGNPQGKHEVITFRNSFHGRTLATLTATGQDKVKEGFHPLPSGFALATFNDIDSVDQAASPRTTAVLLEVVQGEGGVLPATPEFLQALQAWCAEKDVLLLCDEVQCGMGRTGDWWGWKTSGITPDAFSIAKGMGGGFPIGGVSAAPRVSDVLMAGSHATTFGGTPLACAASLAIIGIIEEENLLANATVMGTRLRESLAGLGKAYSWIKEVRGVGLINGLVLEDGVKAAGLAHLLMEKGLLTLATANTVIRLVPPLTITDTDVDEAVSIISEACAAWEPDIEEQNI